MSLGEQIAFGYGVLSVLATAFLLLMAYWQYKKPVIRKLQPIFFRLVGDDWKWFVQLANGEEIGPFKSEETAKDYRAWYNRHF